MNVSKRRPIHPEHVDATQDLLAFARLESGRLLSCPLRLVRHVVPFR
jgi:hypothetical protein